MIPVVPEDIILEIFDALDYQYTKTWNINDIWDPKRISALRRCALTCQLFNTLAQPRLLAHIDFDVQRPDPQGRAARLLQLLRHANPEASSHPIRSVRLRDGRKLSTSFPPISGQPPFLSPLERLMELFLEAPELRVFSFEGDAWTLAGSSEVVGYREYLCRIRSKSSLRVLALVNVYNLPIEVMFPTVNTENGQRTRLQSIELSLTSFVRPGDNGGQDSTTRSNVLDTIEHMKLGRLNYEAFFNILTSQQLSSNSMKSAFTHSTLFQRLTALSLGLPLPQHLPELWNFVYGVKDTLERLDLRDSRDRIDIRQLSVAVDTAMSGHTLDLFLRLKTLGLRTHIRDSPKTWTQSTGHLRSGIPYLTHLIGTTKRPIPSLEIISLELCFMGDEEEGDAGHGHISLANAADDPVWQAFDRALLQTRCQSVETFIVLRPFFYVPNSRAAVQDTLQGGEISKDGNCDLDRCLPELFESGQEVDVRVAPIFSDKRILDYLGTAY